jgi:hypothetical protein
MSETHHRLALVLLVGISVLGRRFDIAELKHRRVFRFEDRVHIWRREGYYNPDSRIPLRCNLRLGRLRLLQTPSSHWGRVAVGEIECLVAIPSIALMPFTVLLFDHPKRCTYKPDKNGSCRRSGRWEHQRYGLCASLRPRHRAVYSLGMA